MSELYKLTILIVILVLGCGEAISEYYEHQVRTVLKTTDPQSYRDKNHDNILHLAIRSGDQELIRFISQNYPKLHHRDNNDKLYPFELAIRSSTLTIVKLVDSLVSVSDADAQGSFKYPNKLLAAFRTAQSCITYHSEYPPDNYLLNEQEMVAESIYVYLLGKLTGTHAFAAWADREGAFKEACRLYKSGYHKAFYAMVSHFDKDIANIQDHALWRQNDPVSLSLLTHFRLPTNETTYLFYAIGQENFRLMKCLVDSGIIINDMSVYNGKVKSALTYAAERDFKDAVELLKAHGATDSIWYELLVPGYWPNISSGFSADRVWHTIKIAGDSTLISSGKLDQQDLTVQRREYWKNKRDHTLFMVATNRAGGISSFSTCLAGPKELVRGDSLVLTMPSGKIYQVTVPSCNRLGLVVTSGMQSQELCHYSNDPALRHDVSIIWAGDLDGDALLDIVFTHSPIDASGTFGPYLLALSTLATKNQLLGWADDTEMYGTYEAYSEARKSGFRYYQYYPWHQTLQLK